VTHEALSWYTRDQSEDQNASSSTNSTITSTNTKTIVKNSASNITTMSGLFCDLMFECTSGTSATMLGRIALGAP
jgi:hypothetical protein